MSMFGARIPGGNSLTDTQEIKKNNSTHRRSKIIHSFVIISYRIHELDTVVSEII